MEDQQQYQTNFSVPESLEFKTMLQRISINILIHILLYITPLLDYLVTIHHFSTYFHREQIYIYKTIQFIFQQGPFVMKRILSHI